MSFKKLQVQKYPRRLWELVGRPGSGKSTFLTQMRSPILPVDADHRIDEVARLNPDMLELSNVPEDHNSPDRIAAILGANMPGAKVGTIGIDSLTTIIAPLVVQAMIDKEKGRIKNQYAGFREKALAMRQLQDNVTKWGTDVLWIFHLDDATDADGNKSVKETISRTELARLMRSVNLKLEVVIQDGKRGIKIRWARNGRWGNKVPVLWDESGRWTGMPERIESAVYDGLTEQDQAEIETALPESFPDDATAIAWGMEQGAFKEIAHARNAFDKLMREQDEPESVEERTSLWVGEVLARLETLKSEHAAPANGNGNGHKAPAPEQSAEKAAPTPITSHEFWTRAIELGQRGNGQIFITANTENGKTDWSAALRDLEAKAQAGAGR